MLAALPNLKLTLVLGRWALDYHLPDAPKTVTAAVLDWQSGWPKIVPLPHPSPRNQAWFKKNPWFEAELLPKLRGRIKRVLR